MTSLDNAKKLVKMAAEELKGLSDYEKASIACQLAKLSIMIGHEEAAAKAAEVVPEKSDLENRPPEKKTEAPVQFTDLNEKAKIADTMNQGTAPTQAPEPEPRQKPAEDAPLPPDWADKILGVDELDNTWTARMKANKDVWGHYVKLGTFIKKGIAAKVFDTSWINTKAAEVTDGRVKDITTDFKTSVTPKLVKMFCAYITDEARKMIEQKKKAA